MGSFYSHILRTLHQLRQWVTAGEALIDVRDALEYGWEENNGDYIPATTANAFAPSFLVELISCNYKKYCKKSCFLSFEWTKLHQHVWMRRVCQNKDPPLPRTILDEDLQRQEELY